jgi:monoamine oxidase
MTTPSDGDEVVFPDGYDRLASHLAEGLDVRLTHVVERVQWTADGVAVTTDYGTVTGDTAVITVPVGVLQSDDFVVEPPLPEPVAGALSRLTMNAFEKVFLRFPTKFWDDDVYVIRQQGPESRWWHSWYDLTALHGTPTLLTFAAGPAAVDTRDWSEAEITESVLAQLRRLYGDRVEKPTHVHITDWQDDPFSHGSYAYMKVARPRPTTTCSRRRSTASCTWPAKATWTDDPATVTAAMYSGIARPRTSSGA